MPLNAQRMAKLRKRAMKGGAMSRPPSFSPPLGLWIAGVDYTSFLIVDSPTIRSTAYSQTGVFTFRLDGSIGALAGVAVEQEVTFNKGGVVYAGLIRTITPEDLRPTGEALVVECQDFTSLLNESICAYSNAHTNPVRTDAESDAQRISWLLQSYDRYGITASHVQTLTISMPAQDFSGLTLAAAIKKVLEFGNGSFYVDFTKDLHTFVSETSAAPFGLSDTPDDATTFAFSDFTYPKDSLDLANAVYAIPGTGACPVPSSPDSGKLVTTAAAAINAAQFNIVSLKPTPGGSLVPVGIPGPLTKATTNITPPFGQAPTVDSTMVAFLAATDVITSSSPGWVQAGVVSSNTAVWVKAKCATGEAAPTFSTTPTNTIWAQLVEFAGGNVSPVDRSGAGVSATDRLFDGAVCSGIDTTGGDLMAMSSFIGLTAPSTASFRETFNNAKAVHLGDTGGSSQSQHVSFAYGLSRAAATWYTDEASIATYGRREVSITDTTVTTQAALDLLGTAFLAAHKDPLRHCSLRCRQPGLTAGMMVPITNALHGLVAQPMRIQGLTTTYLDGIVPEFEVQFADSVVTLATQMVALQDQISGGTSSSVAASTLGLLPGGHQEVTANQGPFTASTDLTGLAVTAMTGAGRQIRVVGDANFDSTVGNDTVAFRIMDGSGNLLGSKIVLIGNAGHGGGTVKAVVTPTAGSQTYKLNAARNNGTGNITMVAGVGDPASIDVEDIGPA